MLVRASQPLCALLAVPDGPREGTGIWVLQSPETQLLVRGAGSGLCPVRGAAAQRIYPTSQQHITETLRSPPPPLPILLSQLTVLASGGGTQTIVERAVEAGEAAGMAAATELHSPP